jgi:hypothetical protein
MSRLPNEARDGLMRVWLEILREQHPGVAWVPVQRPDGGADALPASVRPLSSSDELAEAA